MGARKGFLFAIIVVLNSIVGMETVSASEIKVPASLGGITLESPLSFEYNFKKDPFVFNWTFSFEDINKQQEVPIAEMSQNDKILARWKKKQAHLWKNLTNEPFIVNASAYTAAADECGKSDGITASGIKVEENRTLACPASFPFGTKIAIEGMGEYRCEDRGGAIKVNKIDIYMKTKTEAFAFGRRNLLAQVVIE